MVFSRCALNLNLYIKFGGLEAVCLCVCVCIAGVGGKGFDF